MWYVQAEVAFKTSYMYVYIRYSTQGTLKLLHSNRLGDCRRRRNVWPQLAWGLALECARQMDASDAPERQLLHLSMILSYLTHTTISSLGIVAAAFRLLCPQIDESNTTTDDNHSEGRSGSLLVNISPRLRYVTWEAIAAALENACRSPDILRSLQMSLPGHPDYEIDYQSVSSRFFAFPPILLLIKHFPQSPHERNCFLEIDALESCDRI